jgi:ornithine cyclodeaminase
MTAIIGWKEISRVLPRLDLMREIEAGFVAYSRGEAIVPPVGELLFPCGEVHIKYGYIRGDSTFTIKVATGFYDNPAHGLDAPNGLFLLFDSRTGAPVAVLLDEGHLTDIRTAIAGAIAAKYLAPPKIEAIGVIGTGVQAREQVKYLKLVTPCRCVRAFGRSETAVEAFCRVLRDDGYDAASVATPDEVAARANLIVTATPASEPLLMSASVRPGTHITAVGADTPHKNEIDPELFARADIIAADSIAQCMSRGDIHHALARGTTSQDRLVELGAIITGASPGRQNANQITIADLTGVAVQDINIAQAVFWAIRSERDVS